MRRRLPVYAAVALAALSVHVAALAPVPTPDSAEYELLARSLARGEGFTLPVRVRHDATGPVKHGAFGERAPLFPLLLAPLVPLLDDGRPSVAPGLVLVNVVLATLDALLVASIAWGLSKRPRVALAAGVLAAWSPPLVQVSCRLLAEPLGLFLVLAAVRLEALAPLQGVLLALARLARPEALAASVLLLLRKDRRLVAALAFALVTLAALALGARMPQGFLLHVSNFNDVMFSWRPHLEPPTPLHVARLVLANAADLGYYALRYAHAVPLLGLLALVRRDRIAVLAFTLALAAACVWSTRDHVRFLVLPLALLAIPAALEARRLLGAQLFAVFLALSLFPLAWRHASETHHAFDAPNPGPWSVPEPLARTLRMLGPGEAFAAVSPWSLTLAADRAGLLLPVHLTKDELLAFLRERPEVRVVVLREVPHDALTPEPWGYARDLAAVSSRVDVAGARLLWLGGR